MTEGLEQMLYCDPQRLPSRSCERCGGATYGPGYHCIRCERDGHDT